MAGRGARDLAAPGESYRASLSSPFCRLAYEIISKNRLDRPPPLAGRHQLIDPPLCSPSEAAEILADFRRRLEAIVAYCDQIGALPILIVPPANEAGYEPSRSTLPPSVPRPSAGGWSTSSTRPAPSSRAIRRRARPVRGDPRAAPGFRRGPLPAGPAAGTAGPADRGGPPLPGRPRPRRTADPLPGSLSRGLRRGRAAGTLRSILIDGRRELAAISPTDCSATM